MYGCDPECWSRDVLIVSIATSLTTQELSCFFIFCFLISPLPPFSFDMSESTT